jgi:anti-sigma regulatory factor (Ser/Thr protein kinase)
VATVRRAVRERDELPEAALDDLEVVVSELVSNSIRHAGLTNRDTVGMTVIYGERRLRVEVTDHGPGFDRGRVETIRPNADGGFGLSIVSMLSEQWGLDSGHGMVWAEMAYEGGRAPRSGGGRGQIPLQGEPT